MPEVWNIGGQDPYTAMQVGMENARKNRLADLDLAQKIQAEAQNKALNELMKTAVDPVTGKIDVNRLAGGLATGGYGRAVPGLLKEYAGLREAQGKADEQTGKAVTETMKMFRDLLPSDPAKAASWARAAHNNPVLAPYLSQIGSVEDTIAKIPTDPAEYAKWYNQMGLSVDDAIKRSTVTAAEMLPYTQPLSADVLAQKKDIAGAGRTQVSVTTQAESEYGKGVAEQAAKDTNAQFKQAESAVRGIAQTDRAIDLLEKGQPLTGMGADLELGIRRLQQAVAGRKDKTISDTELLEAVLGQDVFQQIQQLGIGARGLDTPAEREFFRQVVSGTKTLNKDTLLQMAKIKRQAQEDIVNAWNQKTQSGELDDWYKYSKRPKKLFDIPKRESTPGQTALSAKDQQALDWANANPRDSRSARIKERLGVK
jgi:hypothetical protein